MVSEITKKVDASGTERAIVKFEDVDGNIDLLLFGGTYQKYKELLRVGLIAKVTGTFRLRDNKYSFFVKKIEPWVIDDTQEKKVEEIPDSVFNDYMDIPTPKKVEKPIQKPVEQPFEMKKKVIVTLKSKQGESTQKVRKLLQKHKGCSTGF